MNRSISILSAILVVSSASTAIAGGYDTPMLYSARHMGMGGAAVGYVYDPSAMFHNPAGLGHTHKAGVLVDFSLLLGTLKGAPEKGDVNVTSNTTVAPFPMVGGALRITDWLTAGIGAYPIASAGGTYEYTNSANKKLKDETKLLFVEVSPGFAINLPGRVHLGAGYRITYMNLSRLRKPDAEKADLDFSMSGFNLASFRLGAQWIALDNEGTPTNRQRIQVGLTYRHKTEVDISADDGTVLTLAVTNLKSSFVLPTKLAAGVRGDLERWGLAVDLERNLNDENERSVIEGEYQGKKIPAPNIFEWSNSWTLRTGVECRLLKDGQVPVRAGYVLDTQTSNEAYPTPFGTPPAKTQVITGGVGYDTGNWQANLAYAYRFGSVKVSQEDTADSESCPFCGKFGDYDIKLHGLYADFSYDFN